MKETYVYMLKCADNTFYVGKTNNIIDRLNRHEKGEIKYTSSRLPIELITYTAFFDEYLAARFEKYLKSGSGRAFSKRHFQATG